jgi:glycosyltransferase involved in cell wall biosynthesis
VITLGKSGSTAEVVGDAGLILDDNSPKSLSDAILNLTSNQILLDHLRGKGRARLKSYSPNEVTRKYISLYERTIGTLK